MTADTHVSDALRSQLKEKSLMLLPVVLLEVGNAEDHVRVWGGVGDLDWNGEVWQGVGNLGRIDPVKSDAKGTMNGLSLSLSGLPEGLLADVLAVNFRGRRGMMWVAAFDADLKMVDEAALMFAGEISAMDLVDTPSSQQVNVTLESRMAILRRVMPALRTDEDQQRRYPGDRFFEFVPNVLNKTIFWGLKASTGSGGGQGVGGLGDDLASRGLQLK